MLLYLAGARQCFHVGSFDDRKQKTLVWTFFPRTFFFPVQTSLPRGLFMQFCNQRKKKLSQISRLQANIARWLQHSCTSRAAKKNMTNFYFISQSICSSTLCLMGLVRKASMRSWMPRVASCARRLPQQFLKCSRSSFEAFSTSTRSEAARRSIKFNWKMNQTKSFRMFYVKVTIDEAQTSTRTFFLSIGALVKIAKIQL